MLSGWLGGLGVLLLCGSQGYLPLFLVLLGKVFLVFMCVGKVKMCTWLIFMLLVFWLRRGVAELIEGFEKLISSW